jgi:hypothetical protein
MFLSGEAFMLHCENTHSAESGRFNQQPSLTKGGGKACFGGF